MYKKTGKNDTNQEQANIRFCQKSISQSNCQWVHWKSIHIILYYPYYNL